MAIVFNEYKWLKDKIENRDYAAMRPVKRTIRNLIKYYYPEFKNKTTKEFQRFILDEMLRFNIDIAEYEEYEFADYTKNMCRKAIKGEFNTVLRDSDTVEITQGELDIIAKAENDRQKKLLFTLYVLAKLSPYHSGWVNYRDSEIFKLANLHLSVKDQDYLIHDLYAQGLLQLNHIIGKSGLKVELVEDSPTGLVLDLEKSFGNQYMAYIKKSQGWTYCHKCGKLIKKKAPNQKYCDKCNQEAYKEQNKESHRRKYHEIFSDSEESCKPL